MNQLTSLVRIQLQTWRSTVFLPWAVLVISFAVNLITLVTDKDPGQGRSMGGLVALYVFVAISFSATSGSSSRSRWG